jgi:hypothetical protein
MERAKGRWSVSLSLLIRAFRESHFQEKSKAYWRNSNGVPTLSRLSDVWVDSMDSMESMESRKKISSVLNVESLPFQSDMGKRTRTPVPGVS